MRNSAVLVMLAAVGAAGAFMGCSSSDDSGLTSSTGGGGASSHAGSGGTSSSKGGSGGSLGVSGGGATSTAGTGSAAAGAGGAAAGAGGAAAGAGGAAAGAGGAAAGAGGAAAGAGGAAAGAGGAAAGAGGSSGAGVDCADENTGVGTGSNVTAAVVLIDDVEIKDTTSTLATSWEFADATTIADVNTARPGDKWSRTSYGNADITGASDTFLACAGNPAAGSLKNIIPFSDDNQYYQVSVLFAAHNYKSYTVTANVKLVGGGRTTHPTCQAGAFLYAVGYVPAAGGSAAQYPNSHKDTDPFTPLVAGKWTPITLTIPADAGFDMVQELAVQVSTYSCGTGN